MCGPYWSQWSKVELDSMHGIEPSDHEEDEEVDGDFEEDREDEESYGCSSRNPCSNCMDCLGLSWRDFM